MERAHFTQRTYALYGALFLLIGSALAALFVAGLLWLDIGHLHTLVINSRDGWIAVFILWFCHALLFAAVQTGVAMTLRAQNDTG